MILCLDIGNTNITAGIFDKQKLILRFDMPTAMINNENKLTAIFKKNLPKKILKEAVICSVVPKVTKILKNTLKKKFGFKCIEIGKEIKAPIKNRYSKPGKVGRDRLVNAVAAVHLYGKPAIIVDFGTCITFDCISRKAEYLGGLIMPGIELTLNMLHNKTALLPKVKMHHPKALIGRDTKESIRSGLYYGFLGGCEYVIKKIKKRLGIRTLVIGTGGYTDLFKTKPKLIDISNPNLTLQGLSLIYSKKEQKKLKK